MLSTGKDLDAAAWKKFFALSIDVNEELLARSRQAAKAGAKIVLWAEALGTVTSAREAAFIKRGQQLAQRHQIYLGMAMWVFLHHDLSKTPKQKMVENKFVLLTPDGHIAWSYRKVIPVPGMEQRITVPGEKVMPTLQTPYGRLGAAICFDMDFPQLIQKAGQAGVDLLLVPAGDWKEISPFHTYMASMRAIENGFSMLRATNNGFSGAFDYQGRLLAGMEHATTRAHTMYADVPVKGTRTIYARLGDWMVLLSLVATLAFLGVTIRRKLQAKRG